ncbi:MULTISPECIES: M48 family metallopeptidase [Basfia]|uniref:HtpX protein n=2 Tax=Basfia TaxID=697331 RepID=Q65VG6_MANSM|nr:MULTISPECIES: M48 family metallopeptidase [Basfia]AAU37044.1 HtpX protein [[Mannheimia] succiniciproducens MBEL55E]QIM67908.1 deoxyribonuclease HsdR [Basfia succiniciproducens]SCY12724.1 Zn-dependent protease with chaperone function [Basfia succiniciproducens]SEQ39908.1 Zn-dependent protease with chaperone function [Basfia succiniciproducens]
MFKKSKKIFAVSFIVATLAACADTAQINQEAASSYTQTINQARAKGVVDTSSATSKRIQSVFNQMVPYADKENTTGVKFNWQLTVVKSNELNAWAMPGGKMMFYTGLVDKLNLTNDEIAVVMGHEMAHALQEHGKQSRNVGIMTGILGAAADIAAAATLGVDTGGLGGTVADLGVNKPFSRSNETEADEIGLFLMAKAGFNPQAAPQLWVKMQKAGGSNGPSLLSTHPSDASRQENLQRLMPEALKIYKARNSK